MAVNGIGASSTGLRLLGGVEQPPVAHQHAQRQVPADEVAEDDAETDVAAEGSASDEAESDEENQRADEEDQK